MARHRWIRWLAASLILVVALVVGGPYVFIHFIEGPPKPKLALPKSEGTTPSSAPRVPLSGTWNVTSGSKAGYRVQEVLLGQSATAVGRTSDVSGALVLDGNVLRSARFSVPLATVVSDQSERNAAFDGRIMDIARWPTATFTLTSPISFGRPPAPDTVVATRAEGKLTMHGVTHALRVKISAKRSGSSIYVLADATVIFADWHIQNPSVGGFVTTANQGTLEVLLHLVKGRVPTTTTTTIPRGGGSGPVTLPATTVPPLSIAPKR
ncbi:MAG TPA: YceI family protein [Acidimicrobiales bacterium]|nr:YceI family protein [Acidimicrobiales bacterium]